MIKNKKIYFIAFSVASVSLVALATFFLVLNHSEKVLGTSTSLEGQVLATSSTTNYTKIALVTVAYELKKTNIAGIDTDTCPVHYPGSKYPTTYVNSVSYCGSQMSRIGGYCGISQKNNQAVEMWYVLGSNLQDCKTPSVNFINCPQPPAAADPKCNVGNWRASHTVIDGVPTVNFVESYNRAGTVSQDFQLTKGGPKDSKFVCAYSNFPNSGANKINAVYPTGLGWIQVGDTGYSSAYPKVQTGMGISYPRTSSGETAKIRWHGTQSQTWAGICMNLNLKPVPTPAPIPPSVDLKVNGSDGPITVNKGTTLSASWAGTYATQGCVTSWGGGQTEGQVGSSTIPNNFTGTSTFSILCVGTDPTSRASDSVTVTIVNAPTVDLKVNDVDGPITAFTGDYVKLTWTSTNATSCTASGAWSGAKSTSGIYGTPAITAKSTFTLTCGSATDSVTVDLSTEKYDSNRCWEKSEAHGADRYWIDQCKGDFSLYINTKGVYFCSIPTPRNITPTLVAEGKFSPSEITQYNNWVSAGSPKTPCQ